MIPLMHDGPRPSAMAVTDETVLKTDTRVLRHLERALKDLEGMNFTRNGVARSLCVVERSFIDGLEVEIGLARDSLLGRRRTMNR
jgi:hypothetical protein